MPYFRHLILSFKLNGGDELEHLDDQSRHVVQFVCELRKLFAFMQSSRRRAINPNQTLRLLCSCSKYDVDTFNQEDVSEFATRLVNLIEESFDILHRVRQQQQQQQHESNDDNESHSTTLTSTSTSTATLTTLTTLNNSTEGAEASTAEALAAAALARKNCKNPIVNLLNGDILRSRTNSDERVTSSMVEIFREVNVQMCNARTLHEGLELEWGETSIDRLSTPPTPSGAPRKATTLTEATKQQQQQQQSMNRSFYEQEAWVVKLPAVFFVCLNRYKFVQATQSSSKILEPFEFYPHIYLDR